MLFLCDFQYCGAGTPAQDLAYFFCSSINEDEHEDSWEERQDEYLAYYVTQLASYLPPSSSAVNPPTLEALRDSLDWAYCDFQRFMMGWGTWGNDLTERVRAKLDTLDGGRNLGSEEAYCDAMRAQTKK